MWTNLVTGALLRIHLMKIEGTMNLNESGFGERGCRGSSGSIRPVQVR